MLHSLYFHVAPNGTITVLAVNQTTSTSIKVIWELPELNNRQGVISNYNVTYQRLLQAGGSAVNGQIPGLTNMTGYIANGLTAGSQYIFAVSACTSVGCGVIKTITTNTSDAGKMMGAFDVYYCMCAIVVQYKVILSLHCR